MIPLVMPRVKLPAELPPDEVKTPQFVVHETAPKDRKDACPGVALAKTAIAHAATVKPKLFLNIVF